MKTIPGWCYEFYTGKYYRYGWLYKTIYIYHRYHFISNERKSRQMNGYNLLKF